LLSWYVLLFLLRLILLPIPAYAQELGPTTWEWRTFTSDNSPLAPGEVEELLEDFQGHIWIITSRDLSVYQGGVWQTFTADNCPLVPSEIHIFLEDSQGRTWVGTGWDLNLYQDGVWQTFTAENSSLAPGQINALLEDSQGRIWAGTGYYDSETCAHKGGVSLYQTGAWQTSTAEDSSLAPGRVEEFMEDSQGRIWVRTGYWDGETYTFKGGVSLYRAGAWQTFTSDNSPLAPGRVTELMEDSQGRIWIGTCYDYDGMRGLCKGGLNFYQDGAWQTFTIEYSTQAPFRVSVMEDSQGRIWAGTGYYDNETGAYKGGASFYQDGVWQTFTADNSPLAWGWVSEFVEDFQGRVWIHTGYYDGRGTNYKGTVSIYQDGALQNFTRDTSPLAPREVNVLLKDSQDRIWVGTEWGIALYQTRAWQTFPGQVHQVLEDSQGRI